MQNIAVVSDVHLGSVYSKCKDFYYFIENLETDLLILNGDIYDLYLGPPISNIFELIENNPKIKDYKYIRGNHDHNIDTYFPLITFLDEVILEDIHITHGDQYDWLVKEESKLSGSTTRLRNKIEKIFKFNVKVWSNKLFGKLINWILFRANKEAAKAYPDKRVIIGHTHIPVCNHPHYNSGGFVDDVLSYIEIAIDDDKKASINLIQIR